MRPSAFFKYLTVAAIAAAAAVVVTYADAETLRGDKANCAHFSTLIYRFGEMRDEGAPWEFGEMQVDKMLVDAESNPNAYVKTPADAKWVKDKIKALWFDFKDVTAIEVAAIVYEECMQTTKLKKRKTA